MAGKITTAVAVTGEKEYRAAIQNCNSELSLLKSSLAATQSEFRNNAESMEALSAKGDVLTAMYNAQQEKVNQMASAMQNAQKAQEEYGKKIENLRVDLVNAEKAMEELASAGGLFTKEAEEQRNAINELNAEIKETQQYYDAAEAGVDKWQKSLNYATVELNQLGDEVSENQAAIDRLENGTEEATEATEDFSKAAKDGANSGGLFAEATEKIGEAFTAAAVVGAIKETAEVIRDLATEMQAAQATIVAGTGAIGSSLDNLTDSALNVYTQVDVEDLNSVAQAVADVNTRFGVTGQTLEKVSQLMIDFSDITGSNIQNNISNVSKIMKTWNVDIENTEKLLDQMTAASQGSGLGVEQMASSLIENKSALLQMGYTLEESIALLAAIEASGMNVSTVFGGMRQAISALSAEGGDVSESLNEVIQKIAEMGNTSEATALAVQTFGADAGIELALAISSGTFALEDWVAMIEEADGTMRRSETAADTWGDKWQQAANTVKASVYDAMPRLTQTVEELTQAAREVSLDEMVNDITYAGTQAQVYASRVQELMRELIELEAAGMDTAEAHERYAEVVAEINALMPELNLSISEETGLIAQNTQEVLANVEAWKTRAQQQAASNLVTESYNELVTVTEELMYNEAKLAEEEARLARLEADRRSILLTVAAATGETEESTKALLNRYTRTSEVVLTGDLKELADTYADLTTQIDRTTDTIEVYSEAIEIGRAAIEQAESAYQIAAGNYQSLADSTDTAKDSTEGMTQATQTLQAVYAAYVEDIGAQIETEKAAFEALKAEYTAVSAAATEMAANMYGVMEELPDVMSQSSASVSKTLDDLNRSLESQAQYWEDYADNIAAAIERGVDEGLVEQLSDGSTKSAEILAALATATDEQIAQINASWTNAGEGQKAYGEAIGELSTNFSEEAAKIEERMAELVEKLNAAEAARQAGLETIDAYAAAAEDGAGAVETSFYSVGVQAAIAFNEALQANLVTPDELLGEYGGGTSFPSGGSYGGGFGGAGGANITINTTSISDSQIDYVISKANQSFGKVAFG